MEKGIQLTAIIVTALATISLSFFGWQQMRETNQLRNIQKTTEWSELRNTMWELIDQYPYSGITSLDSLSNSEKIDWLKKIRKLLDSQSSNFILIEDKYALGHWRNAISTTKIAITILQIDPNKETNDFIKSAISIHGDIMRVWSELILHSDEVSATGGRPAE